jgi:hypothetical protein
MTAQLSRQVSRAPIRCAGSIGRARRLSLGVCLGLRAVGHFGGAGL